LPYAQKHSNTADNEFFWTKTKQGLEICKWLGQAFVENKTTARGGKSRPTKKGDILKFYEQIAKDDTKELRALLSYLQEVNWDLSCWYKLKYPSHVQVKWKIYWKQLVMPHFGWETIRVVSLEKPDKCQMCGKQDVRNMYWIFHSKFRVSEKFLKLPKKEQMRQEQDEGITEASYDSLPDVLKQKRRQSLCVGVNCFKVLSLSKTVLSEWRNENTFEEQEEDWDRLVENEVREEARERAEREFRKMGL